MQLLSKGPLQVAHNILHIPNLFSILSKYQFVFFSDILKQFVSLVGSL